jgi:hypothetical protein
VEGVTQEFFVRVTGKDTVFCHDNYPPEVVMPLPVDVIDRSDGAARIIGKYFKTNDEAVAYLKSMFGVKDDCAPASDLDLVVTYIDGTCDQAKFTITPTHDTGCGVVEGVAQEFFVTVDGSPPEPMCSYGVGETIPKTGSGILVDAQLTYSVQENCGGPVSVTVETFSNELEDVNAQQMALLFRDTETSNGVGLWVASTICSTSSNGQCITDPNEPGRRYYVTTVTATDESGLTGETGCFVEITKDGRRLQGNGNGRTLAVPGLSVQRFRLGSLSTTGYIPSESPLVSSSSSPSESPFVSPSSSPSESPSVSPSSTPSRSPSKEPSKMLVEQFYCRVLQRPPESDQAIFAWVGYLKSHTVKDLVSLGILGDEFKIRFVNGKSDETLARTLYDVLLARAADPGGLAHWRKVVRDLGWEHVVDQFLASTEYNNSFGDNAVPGGGRAGCG